MLLRHATPRKNLASIQQLGLLCSKSQGRLKVVWLHAPSKTPWAVRHVAKRHGALIQDVVVLEVRVPRKWLRRNRWRVWYSRRDIPPGRLSILQTIAKQAAATNV